MSHEHQHTHADDRTALRGSVGASISEKSPVFGAAMCEALQRAGVACTVADNADDTGYVWDISSTLRVTCQLLKNSGHEFWVMTAFDPIDEIWVEVTHADGPWHQLLRDVLYGALTSDRNPITRLHHRWTPGTALPKS